MSGELTSLGISGDFSGLCWGFPMRAVDKKGLKIWDFLGLFSGLATSGNSFCCCGDGSGVVGSCNKKEEC